MRKNDARWNGFFRALPLVLASALALLPGAAVLADDAQPAKEQPKKQEKKQEPEQKQEQEQGKESSESGDSADIVYTTDYLQKHEAAPETSSVTNKTLEEQYAAPSTPPGTAYTNDDLKKLFGDEPAAQAEAAAGAEAAPEGAAEGAPAAPAMSAAERDARIAEIEAQIAALQRELDELRRATGD